MVTTETTAKDRTTQPGDATANLNAYGEISALTRSAPSLHNYYSSVVEILAKALASPCAAISIRDGSDVIEVEYEPDQNDVGFWMPGVQQFLTDTLVEHGNKARLLESKDGESKVALLSATLFDDSNEPIGAVAVVVSRKGSLDAAKKLMFLEALACFASYAGQADRERQDQPASIGDTSKAMARAAAFATPEELAFALTNNLRNKLGCEQVALGLAVRNEINIISISGLDRVAEQSTGVQAMRSAMEECLDADHAMTCAAESAWSGDDAESRFRLHQQWRTAVTGDAVASIPLHAQGKIVMVISLRREADRPFTKEQIEQIRGNLEPFAGAMVLLRESKRGLLRHGADVARDAITGLMSKGRYGRKLLVLALMATSAWVAFGEADYSLTVPCLIKPKESRHITAPFDGMLVETNVFQGDVIKRGDVLCRFDHRDLRQSRTELSAESNIYEREKDHALANEDTVRYQLASANQKLTQARLKIIDTRIARCTVRSPIDGVVIAGDLRTRIGSVLALGDPLFEIAPPHSLIVELAVPESDADDVALNLAGTFAPIARPQQVRNLRVTRIHPQTEIRERGNACVVEATASLDEGWLRPGMVGVAKIHVGRRRVWWVGVHRIIDFLRIKFWL